MSGNDRGLVELEAMAENMASSTPMSAGMLLRLVEDVRRGGPLASFLGDHPDVTAPLFRLRVLSGVKWLVLSGRSPALQSHLRNLTAGMRDPAYIDATWALFREAFLSHPKEMWEALGRPVQQHQPGRAGHLLSGLAMLGAPRVRLLEIGACAGLNLLVDRYRWFGNGWEWGDEGSAVRFPGEGRNPGPVEIVYRAGCDLLPRDPSDPEDVKVLRSFIAHERDLDEMDLCGALDLAARTGFRVEESDAVPWLRDQLDQNPVNDDSYTVVWHSLFIGYLNSAHQREIEDVMADAARRMRLARISYEPNSWMETPRLQVAVYS